MDHDPLHSPARAPGGESAMMRFFLPGLVVGMVLGSMLGLYVGTRSGGTRLPDTITSLPRSTGPDNREEAQPAPTPNDRADEAPPPEKPAEQPAEKPQETAPKTP